MPVRFLPAGDTALVIEFGEHADRALSDRVLRLSERIRSAGLPGLVETVPTFRSLAVHYDPTVTSAQSLREAASAFLEDSGGERRTARLWRVPACYHPRYAPDLDEVAERTGLAPEEVGALHAATTFHVYMIGFAPGLPYMGDLPEQLVLPRRVDPRVRVPAGSLAIATTLTNIYPYESPGGWHLIGATPIRLFDLSREDPAIFRPGDAVRFEPVDPDTYEALRAAVAQGTYMLASESVPA
jgi:KipI family sensor histidine kinase inhibitor